jgi:4-hydroxy-tetrahydrodipicolinate synthase
MNAFKGIGVALVTPFQEDQRIDFDSLKRLIDHVIAGGVDYLVVLGTTGESATLTASEKAQVLKAAVEYNKGRVPLMLGLGGNATQKLIDEIEQTDFPTTTNLRRKESSRITVPWQMRLQHH